MTAVGTRSAILATGLRKSYGDHVVLAGIDLDIAEGTVFALLGPNGAGKTTTVHILSTLIGADGGEVQVAGHDVVKEPDAVRAVIGLTGQVSAVDRLFTGEENLRLMADLRHLGKTEGRRRVAALLEQFDLVDAATKPVGIYSGGMKRRLDLAMTLVGDPRIIFLDEPTAGLDPRSRRVMWDIIHDLVARGVTIFLTTQYLEEADRLAHQIAVLDRGQLVAQGTPNELKRLVPGGHVQLSFSDATELARAARIFADGTADEEGLTLNIPSDGGTRSLRELLDRLDAGSIDVGGLVVQTPGPRRRLPVADRQPRQARGDRPMNTYPLVVTDTATMLRRNLRRARRYPSLTFFIAAIPVVFLLLFVFVLGGTLGAGLGGVAGGRAEYTAYVLPGILLVTVAGAAQGTAISVAMDMSEGIIARFRTMAVARSSVLTGHVIGSVIQTMLAIVIVMVVAVLIGFRSTTGPVEWLAAAGLLALTAVAISWLSVALGMVSKSVETASNLPMFLVILPFLSSGFVPTDSMPDGLNWFAENQPFTPLIETVRGLLLGTPIGNSGIVGVAWCIGISVVGFLWARRLYDRDPAT